MEAKLDEIENVQEKLARGTMSRWTKARAAPPPSTPAQRAPKPPTTTGSHRRPPAASIGDGRGRTGSGGDRRWPAAAHAAHPAVRPPLRLRSRQRRQLHWQFPYHEYRISRPLISNLKWFQPMKSFPLPLIPSNRSDSGLINRMVAFGPIRNGLNVTRTSNAPDSSRKRSFNRIPVSVTSNQHHSIDKQEAGTTFVAPVVTWPGHVTPLLPHPLSFSLLLSLHLCVSPSSCLLFLTPFRLCVCVCVCVCPSYIVYR